jgi:hypothetical protein
MFEVLSKDLFISRYTEVMILTHHLNSSRGKSFFFKAQPDKELMYEEDVQCPFPIMSPLGLGVALRSLPQQSLW